MQCHHVLENLKARSPCLTFEQIFILLTSCQIELVKLQTGRGRQIFSKHSASQVTKSHINMPTKINLPPHLQLSEASGLIPFCLSH